MTETESQRTFLPRVGRDTDHTEIGDLLAEHGAVIVEGLLPPEVVAAVNTEVDGAVAAADTDLAIYNAAVDAFHGEATKHVSGLAAKSRTFATEVMVHPLYRSLCDRFLTWGVLEKLGLGRTEWMLNLGHMIVRGPGGEAQMLHRDEDVWMDMPYPRGGQLQLASMLAFVDFTEENGATRLIPRSHLWPGAAQPLTERTEQLADADVVFAEMPAGSALVYFGTTVHGGGANTTDDVWRRGVHLSFTLSWLRTEENNYLAVPPDVARTLPLECQKVLGYGSAGLVGAVDLQDPLDLLASGRL
jgi:ectoine hydroxylase-related dioxygenase (phytanoyl-CoA dioxygenase family)